MSNAIEQYLEALELFHIDQALEAGLTPEMKRQRIYMRDTITRLKQFISEPPIENVKEYSDRASSFLSTMVGAIGTIVAVTTAKDHEAADGIMKEFKEHAMDYIKLLRPSTDRLVVHVEESKTSNDFIRMLEEHIARTAVKH